MSASGSVEEKFERWWAQAGQYSRAGGGSYEKTFAYNAWRAALEQTDAFDEFEQRKALDGAQCLVDYEAIALRPCPFCGPGNSVPQLWFDDLVNRYKVSCGACGSSTGISPRDKTPRPAIEAWNRRIG